MWLITLDNLNSDSGQALRIKNLIEGMSGYCDINLLSRSRLDDKALLSSVKSYKNIDIGVDDFKKLLNDPFAVFKFVKLFRWINNSIHDSEMIYTDSFMVPYYRFFSSKKNKIVMEVNGINSEELISKGAMKRNSLEYRLLKLLEKYSYNHVGALVVVTRGLKEYLIREFNVEPSRIHVIPNGVDTHLFDPNTDGNTVRERYRLGKNPVIFFVGNFRPWHGIENIVLSFKLVLKTIPDARLLLVGDGPTRCDIEKLISEQGLGENVVLAGHQNPGKIPMFIAACDVCTYYPSYELKNNRMEDKRGYAGNPIKFLEYMSMGKPTVTIQIQDLADVIEASDSGIVVESTSYEGFSDAIIRLIQDRALSKKLGENGRKAVENEYGWEVISKRIFDVCKEYTCGGRS